MLEDFGRERSAHRVEPRTLVHLGDADLVRPHRHREHCEQDGDDGELDQGADTREQNVFDRQPQHSTSNSCGGDQKDCQQ